MAEAAFAIIGGISALGAIAGTVGNISVKILDIAQHAGMAKDEIVEFGSDVQEFSSQLLMVQESLENHCSERQSPRTCKWVDNHNVIPQAMRKSKRVKDRLKQITRQFRKFKNTVSWFCKIKWILQKSLVMALRVEMNSVKTSLILVLNTVRLEEAMQVNPESKEVKTLKNLNLALQYALLRLEKQLTEYDIELLDDRVETYEAIQDLIRLTESIEKRGIIPSTSRTSRRRHGYGEERRPANQLPTAPINPEATQAGPENSSGTTHVPVAADELTRSPDIVNEILEPHEPNEASSSQRPEPRDELDNHVDFEAAQVAQVHNENQTAIAEHDREYQDVRPVNAVIHIPRHNSQSIGGYINDNQRMVTAIVNEGLDVNLISQAFATRHGIDIEFLDEASGEARPLFDLGKAAMTLKLEVHRSNGMMAIGAVAPLLFTVLCVYMT